MHTLTLKMKERDLQDEYVNRTTKTASLTECPSIVTIKNCN